mmetsp:Transcript_4841/g.7338  ORF Transcript_4841/g.7338 Transcript_4841/m.7338 type:complete len:213 (-) Transcript_4841:96-734(-)
MMQASIYSGTNNYFGQSFPYDVAPSASFFDADDDFSENRSERSDSCGSLVEAFASAIRRTLTSTNDENQSSVNVMDEEPMNKDMEVNIVKAMLGKGNIFSVIYSICVKLSSGREYTVEKTHTELDQLFHKLQKKGVVDLNVKVPPINLDLSSKESDPENSALECPAFLSKTFREMRGIFNSLLSKNSSDDSLQHFLWKPLAPRGSLITLEEE